MVDALASGASTGNGVEVRVLSWAPLFRTSPSNNELKTVLIHAVVQCWLCNAIQGNPPKTNTFVGAFAGGLRCAATQPLIRFR